MVEPITTTLVVSLILKGAASGLGSTLGKATGNLVLAAGGSLAYRLGIHLPRLPEQVREDSRYQKAIMTYAERDLQLREQDLQARQEFSRQLLELLGEWQVNTNKLKLRETQNNWDKDNWFSKLDRQETEQILGQQQHRLLILASQPEISPDCPDSFHNNLKTDIRNGTGAFLSQYYPLGDALRPVEFFGDYFKVAISDIDVKRLQVILGSVPTVILYSDITDYQVNFHVGFWGLQGSSIPPYSLPSWNWEETFNAFKQEGSDDKGALRDIRRIIVAIHQLLAAFVTDWYYLHINPLYEPQLFQLEPQFPPEWLQPYLEQLRQPYCLNQAGICYERGLRLTELQRYREAVASFDKAVAFLPESAEAWYQRGKMLHELGRTQEAIESYNQAFDLGISQLPDAGCHQFDTITVDARGQEINRKRGEAKYFTEDLGNGIALEMVLIPGGKFMMGFPPGEERRGIPSGVPSLEVLPQHEVTVQPFFMGKFPVTQAYWKAVAALPKVNRDLNPDPSHFKGDNRPVEQINWFDAVEFCKRLSRKTGRNYRLPSEAEWEYACRAGTTTAFHFGETITPDLANYNSNYSYADEPQGKYREETTSVGQFPPNAFGLYDMHGNVEERCAYTERNSETWSMYKNFKNWCVNGWCAYPYGETLEAPDNRMHYHFITLRQFDVDNRISLRGGSWDANPICCRCACNRKELPHLWSIYYGFRVVCDGRRGEDS